VFSFAFVEILLESHSLSFDHSYDFFCHSPENFMEQQETYQMEHIYVFLGHVT